MSKTFDALNKSQSDVASLALPIIKRAGKADEALSLDTPPASNAAGLLISNLKAVPVEEARNHERLGRIVVQSDPASIAADKFRLLRVRLRKHWAAGKLKTILITSPLPEDGKTTVTLNLATALIEERKRKVLVIDGDLHRGSIDLQLGLLPQVGLAECLQQATPPLTAIRQIEPFGWHYLSSGKLRLKNPTEVLQPQQVSELIKKLTHYFDWIIVDSPPVLPLSDAVALVPHLDGTLLVARAGVTPAKAVEDAIRLVGRSHIVGLVLNGVEKADQPYSSSYAHYRREI